MINDHIKLKVNSSLISLNLGSNRINLDTVKSIAGALQINSSLRSLDLSLCNLQIGAAYIANASIKYPTFVMLPIFDRGASGIPHSGILRDIPKILYDQRSYKIKN